MPARRWRGLGLLVAAVIALEVICRAGLVRPTDLVPPSQMVVAMIVALGDHTTRMDLFSTLTSVALSVIIATVVGVVAGVVLHALPRVRRACEPFIASYYALPLFALYPVLVVIFGIGTQPIVFTGVLYAAMSVVIATLSGLDHIPRVFYKVGKVQRLRWPAITLRILLPAAATDILGGISLAVSYAFVAVIASEFLLAPEGIGRAIADAYTTFQIRRMYGLMLLTILIVVSINMALRSFHKRLGQAVL
jgi:NitT/TauT family transport system permease protein